MVPSRSTPRYQESASLGSKHFPPQFAMHPMKAASGPTGCLLLYDFQPGCAQPPDALSQTWVRLHNGNQTKCCSTIFKSLNLFYSCFSMTAFSWKTLPGPLAHSYTAPQLTGAHKPQCRIKVENCKDWLNRPCSRFSSIRFDEAFSLDVYFNQSETDAPFEKSL